MLEVVFEQGTAGSLKIAKSSRPGQKSVRTMSAVCTGDMAPGVSLPRSGRRSMSACVGDGWLYLRLMEQVKAGAVRIVEPARPDQPYSGTILRVTT